MAELSAEDVQPKAQTALSGSPIYELRELQVDQSSGALTISGTVTSFYHKQLAQELIRTVCDGIDFELVNQIRVR